MLVDVPTNGELAEGGRVELGCSVVSASSLTKGSGVLVESTSTSYDVEVGGTSLLVGTTVGTGVVMLEGVLVTGTADVSGSCEGEGVNGWGSRAFPEATPEFWDSAVAKPSASLPAPPLGRLTLTRTQDPRFFPTTAFLVASFTGGSNVVVIMSASGTAWSEGGASTGFPATLGIPRPSYRIGGTASGDERSAVHPFDSCDPA